ncbi:MAG: T9SS type A sorting domain-containing protein [Bacteroidota bacterium]
MKTNLLFAALLSASGLFAQIKPSDVQTPIDIHIFQKDFPGLRSGFTQLKVLTPAVNGNSFATWFNLNIGRSNNTITSTGYSNVDPANPIEDEIRSTGSKTGNTYVALIEMNDQGTWVNSERMTGYFDQNEKDTLWVLEDYNSTTSAYEESTRIEMKYNGSGNFTGFHVYEYDGSDWTFAGLRSIVYSGPERATDSLYMISGDALVPIMLREYTYNNGKIDSIATHTINMQTMNFEFSAGFKVTNGTDGGIDRILTYSITDDGKDSIFVETRTDIINPVSGLKSIDPEQFSIYPVPAKDVLHIDVKGAGNYSAQLFDIQGRLLLTQEVSNNTPLNVSTLSNGVYILTLQQANGQKMQKRILIGQ